MSQISRFQVYVLRSAWACVFLAQAKFGTQNEADGRALADETCYNHGGFTKNQWPHCQKVHEGIWIYYGVSPDRNFLKLGLSAAGHRGWSALALAGNGGMKGAQYFVVRQDNGAWVVEERYATAYTTPQLQETQDVMLMFASEGDHGIAWGVLLPMLSCKDGERYPIEDASRWMHWALGSSHTFAYPFAMRGQFHANLVSGPKQTVNLSNMQEVHLRMPSVDMVLGPGGKDPTEPYICQVLDIAEILPSGLNVNDKHHVVKFAPYLNPSTAKYVHHMTLYACNVGLEQMGMTFTHGQIIRECESMPRGCYDMKYAWTVGSDDIVFPNDVGMPIGGKIRWLALQLHYHNPNKDTGVKDSSGVRLTLASSLRTHDAAILAIKGGGISFASRINLPPGQNNVVIPTMVIPKAATNAWDVPFINLIGALYHGHLAGKRFNIDVTNSGNYVGVIRREKRYDFNHQSFEEPSLKKVSKGDELTFTCSYDTSTRIDETVFGNSTRDEMCWSFIMYYPALPKMTECVHLGHDRDYRSTHCQGVGDYCGTYAWFTAPSVNPPECLPRGDLNSTEAASILRSIEVLQHSSPIDTNPGVVNSGERSAMSCMLLVLVACQTFANLHMLQAAVKHRSPCLFQLP